VIGLSAWALDPAIEDILAKVSTNQSLIKDMQADITTVIKSEMKGKMESEQKGKIWIKGEDKSKIEMIKPVAQITITSGGKMMAVDPATGQKMVQDLKKLREKTGQPDLGQGSMDKKKMLEYFDLKLKNVSGIIVIEAKPKKTNKFLGRVDFTIDSNRYLPVKIEIYNPAGNLVSATKIEYIKTKNVWVISKSVSEVKLPMGSMKAEMRYDNIKINEGISDSIFKIE
jgi:outer membrane lipoprotein-sorting protein